jgi:uncharacterized protein (TIGR02270 family)
VAGIREESYRWASSMKPAVTQPASVLAPVVQQHAEDAAVLHSIRSNLITAAHVKLTHIRRFDDRVAAHLDGLSIAGEYAWPMLDAALAVPSRGAVFAAAVMAIESRSNERLNRLYALTGAVPDAQRGMLAAFGWVEQEKLRGIVSGLLPSPDSFLRYLGIAACTMHRVNPGKARDAALEAPSSVLRARALRACGELGLRDLIPSCLASLNAPDPESRFWAAWSAVLLGNRGPGLDALMAIAEIAGALQSRAFRFALQAMEPTEAHQWLRRLARNPDHQRLLIQGSGVTGDPHYVPWLIGHMSDLKTARLAGEAFSLITGLDLAYLDLERKPPEGGAGGPNDDPGDPNVAMDEDDGLPWPDPERISRWWDANGGGFTAGSRYFLGAPLTRESCIKTLKEGFQRQRILAAHYLCLLEPGTVLFEWRAPSPRQQRLLDGMG